LKWLSEGLQNSEWMVFKERRGTVFFKVSGLHGHDSNERSFELELSDFERIIGQHICAALLTSFGVLRLAF